MRPPDDARRELVARWLEKAEDDWRLCHRLITDAQSYAEATAFHAQQAVEKYLKAFLTWHQVEFPKTHDIKRLLKLAGIQDPSLAEELSDAADLTAYAVEYRYPGEYAPVTRDEAVGAVAVADRVREQIRRRLPADDPG
ncbi:MAG: HEPN domain-containing protein [Planctomycetes bacterium]|nr:HEPN domain-containing protein [Planctomycetota bacterium]